MKIEHKYTEHITLLQEETTALTKKFHFETYLQCTTHHY